MKLIKIKSNNNLQFEVTNSELDLITFALDEHLGFLEYCLANKIINTYDLNEPQFALTPKIQARFEAQLKTLTPMLKILNLFY